MDRGDRFHARGTGPRWPEDAGRRCRVREVTWTARDESARSRVLQDVTHMGRACLWWDIATPLHSGWAKEYHVPSEYMGQACLQWDKSTPSHSRWAEEYPPGQDCF